jgi:sugar phosphate permease
MSVAAGARPTRVRHRVLWLTVLAYLITYMDRVVISTAAPSIQAEFDLSKETMGWVLGAFQISYALFQIPGGWLGDRFGPRAALTAVVTWWSVFTAATVLSFNAASLIVCRFLFGMGEAGAFPIATRSLSRWLLPAERGWAQGLTHAGSRLGGAITPVLVVYLIASLGWRGPFVIFAVIGLIWAAFWWVWYRNTPREHKSVNAAEIALIDAGIGAATVGKRAVPWRQILRSRQMWLLSAMYFCYGWGIVTFLQWFPTYLNDARGFELKAMGLAASMPLLAGVVGDLAGGWLSDAWLKRSRNLRSARRNVAFAGFVIAAGAVPTPRPSKWVEKAAQVSFSMFITNEVVRIAWFGGVNVMIARFALPVAVQWGLWGLGILAAFVFAFLFHALVDTPIQDRIRAWLKNRTQLRSRLMAVARPAVPLKG